MLKAVVCDFDGTLTPQTAPEFLILEKSGLEGGAKNPKFFATAREIADARKIDVYEAMIWVILDTTKQGGFRLTDENLSLGANERIYNPGVEELLEYLREHGVQNYLLSSGLQAYLKQVRIAPYFEEIYASILSYDKNNEVNGIKRTMSVAEKSIALQEVAERVNGRSDDFSGIVYIGDGPTDVVAMEHIKKYGGGTILVQHANTETDLPQVDAETVDLVTIPDFSSNGELAKYLRRLAEI